METRTSEQLYHQIANLVNEMVPEAWDRIVFYAEIRDGYSAVYFYYYPTSKGDPIYSLLIPQFFQINKKHHSNLKDELYDCCEALWEQFKSDTGQAWTSLTFLLENTGAFKTIYDYEDLSQLSPIDKRHNWEAKYLTKTKGE